MAWVLRLVKTGAAGEGWGTDVMEIKRPDGLGDIADLGLTLSEAKLLLANVQREIVAAPARGHVVRRPDCRHCGGVCHVKDYRDHAVATLFGQVTMKLPRFRGARCGGTETGIGWPSHCKSTQELDWLRAHLSALMTYPVAADLLVQLFPVDAGTDPETLRRHTLRVSQALAEGAAIPPETAAPVIAVTLDSTFVRSCEDGERHLDVRVGNVETKSGGRQVFSALARADTDITVLIRRNLDAIGRTDGTELTAFTDGCAGLRRILADAGVAGPPIIDWIHIGMRLHRLEQIVGTLATSDAARVRAKAVIVTEVERLHWWIWNGKTKDGQKSIARVPTIIHHFWAEPDSRKSIAPSGKLWTALHALDGNLSGQTAWLVN